MITFQSRADLGVKYGDTETVVPLVAMDVPTKLGDSGHNLMLLCSA